MCLPIDVVMDLYLFIVRSTCVILTASNHVKHTEELLTKMSNKFTSNAFIWRIFSEFCLARGFIELVHY